MVIGDAGGAGDRKEADKGDGRVSDEGAPPPQTS